MIGYKKQMLFNIVVSAGNENFFNIELEPANNELNEVIVTQSRKTAKVATLESPLSVQRLTTEEIKSNPGGNFDISKAIQALPGVGVALKVEASEMISLFVVEAPMKMFIT